MRVMTFNLKCDSKFRIHNSWKDRKTVVKMLIEKYKCDIIGIQECTDIMFEDLKLMLPQYKFIGEPRSRRFFKERNCLLISKDIEVNNEETIWLSKTPYKQFSSLRYSLFPRICTSAVVGNTEKIFVCNTHLDCFFNITRIK